LSSGRVLQHHGERRPRRRRIFIKQAVLSILLGPVLGTLGFFLAARSIKAPPQVVEAWPIIAAVGVMIVVWFIQGVIIALLARPELESTKVLSMARLYLASQAAAALTPFAGVEIAYQVATFKRLGLPGDKAGAVITIRSMMNGAVLKTAAVVGLFLIPYVPFVGDAFGLSPSEGRLLLVAMIGTVALGGLITFLIVMRKRRRPGSEEESSGKDERGKLAKTSAKIYEYVSHVLDSLVWIWGQESRVVVACLGLMILYWALYPLLGTLALRASGWNGDGWLTVYFAQFVLFIVIPLAPTPGGSGAAEVAFVALMSAYVPHSALLGGVLIWRVLNHYSELVVGAFLAGPRLPKDVKVAKQEIGKAMQELGSPSQDDRRKDAGSAFVKNT
jgi:glycosyltransferase 2 family protein